ncbi:MAG: phage/plasmid primase, P4 family [Chloroflexota bacterium]|nr:phage/plasmid primase, P4 family [Chloroflexota bacterium]
MVAEPNLTTSERHRAAVRLAGLLGYPVFPAHTVDDQGRCTCGKNCGRDIGKHPIAELAPRGLLNATNDPNEVDRFWRSRPEANIAARTGAESGIVVFDVDPRDGGRESLANLEDELGLLPADVPRARTGGDGDHLVFAHPGRRVTSRTKIAPGVDIRADGGYFIVAPSRHASGRCYEWLPGRSPFDVDPPELPVTWLDFLCRNQRERPPADSTGIGDFELSADQIAAVVAILAPYYVEGIRHDLTLAFAGWLGQQQYCEASVAAAIERLALRDAELRGRLRNVVSTFNRLAARESVLGWHRLKELLPDSTLKLLGGLVGTYPRLIVGAHRTGSNGTSPPDEPPPENEPDDGDSASALAIHLTDLGNARRLVEQHGIDLHYCGVWGKWLCWDDRRWMIDDTGEVARRAKRTVGSIYAKAGLLEDRDERKQLVKHALRSEAAARIEAMIKLASTEPGIPIRPDQLDTDPWLLNVQNGVVDLRTGKLLPHDRARLITKMVPVTYDPDATCPIWDTFFTKILGGKPELMQFVQRAIGYSLTGRVTERVLFMLYGLGRNGKSTLLDTTLELLGDYAVRTTTDTILATRDGGVPNDIARLKGMRFVFASEAEENRRLAEAKVKDLTGGDTISARFMRAEWFDFRPEFKIFLGTNHRPDIRGTDSAIWDRIRLIPFSVRISDDEVDPDLKDKLLAERAGILHWAVEGCLAWQRQGLGAPVEVLEATNAYRRESDLVGQFIDDECIVGEIERCTAKELYTAYSSWCGGGGEKPSAQKAFGQRLAERGFDSARVGKSRARYWIGIGLRPRERGLSDESR